MPVVILTKTHSLEDPALVALNWQHSTPLDAIGGSSATSETASLHHWMRARYSFLLKRLLFAPLDIPILLQMPHQNMRNPYPSLCGFEGVWVTHMFYNAPLSLGVFLPKSPLKEMFPFKSSRRCMFGGRGGSDGRTFPHLPGNIRGGTVSRNLQKTVIVYISLLHVSYAPCIWFGACNWRDIY